MMRPNPYLLLIGGLDFSLSDLDANRRGELTSRQRAHLEHRRLREMELCTLGLILLILAGILFELRLMLVVFGAACLVSIMLAVGMRYEEDLRGRVQVVSGRPTFKPAVALPLHPRDHLLIDSQEFSVSQHIKQAFDTGHHYRLYFAPGSRTILSAEVAA